MSTRILDPELYEKIKRQADRVYERHGLYKSAWIQKEYKKAGGRYTGDKPTRGSGLQRWLQREQWIEVKPYVTRGAIVPCGDRKGQACRPLTRANAQTPITLPELIALHGRQKVLQLANKKTRDPDGRVYWKTGKFVASKK